MDIGLKIEQKAGYEVASAVKTPDASTVRESGGDSLSADTLRNRLEEAKVELQEAIGATDMEAMTSLRAEIRSLPDAIKIAEVRDLQIRLKGMAADEELHEENIKLINSVIRQKNADYAEKLKELEPYQKAIVEWDWKLSFEQNDLELLRMNRREVKARLFALSEEMSNETD